MSAKQFICGRCGYETDIKCQMKGHLVHRKKICQPILSDIDIDEVFCKYFPEKEEGKYPCQFCVKTFASRSARIYHEKKCSSDVKLQNEIKINIAISIISQ